VRLTLLDETIPAQTYAAGHGFDPAHVAVRAELGVDPQALAQAGVHLEEPIYLADPADASAAIAWYRRQIGPTAPLSIVLRPGPPTPALQAPCARRPPPPEPTTAPSSTSTPTASTASKP
jgi:hypothetical protein